MNISQQGQNQQDIRELSEQEVKNYFNPSPMPMWTIVALVIGVALIPVGIILHPILLSVIGGIIAIIGCYAIRRWIKSNPDDESYDAWIGSKAIELYARSQYKLDIQPHNQDRVLTIRSYVLPGSEEAEDFPPNEVLMKYGKDGRPRFSINVYTFIFCTSRFLAVYEGDVNVFDLSAHRDIHEIYGYRHIISATTSSLDDTLLYEGEEFPYRTEQFCLKITTGENLKFSAAVKMGPRRTMPDAPTIRLPDTGYDRTLSRLRQILLHYQK